MTTSEKLLFVTHTAKHIYNIMFERSMKNKDISKLIIVRNKCMDYSHSF